MSNAEQIINLIPTLDEKACQLILAFINDLQGKSSGKELDISLIDQIDSLTQQVQNIGEISDYSAEQLAMSYLEDKYNL